MKLARLRNCRAAARKRGARAVSPEALQRLQALYDSGDRQLALTEVEALCNAQPYNGVWHHVAAVLCRAQGDMCRARAHAIAASVVEDDVAGLLRTLAFELNQAGMDAAAVASLEAGWSLRASSPSHSAVPREKYFDLSPEKHALTPDMVTEMRGELANYASRSKGPD